MPTITGQTFLPDDVTPLRGRWWYRIHSDINVAVAAGRVRAGERYVDDTGSGASLTLPVGIYQVRFVSAARAGGGQVQLPRPEEGWYVVDLKADTTWDKIVTSPTVAPGWSSAYELRGSGTPEGSVAATPGTYYTDSSLTNGAVRWVKRTGTGTTGWALSSGDTGWRDVTALTIGGSLAADNTGTLLVRREDSRVRWRFVNLKIAAAVAGSGALNLFDATTPIPAGFRVTYLTPTRVSRNNSTSYAQELVYSATTLTWVAEAVLTNGSASQATRGAVPYLGDVVLPCDNAWPTGALPGIAA